MLARRKLGRSDVVLLKRGDTFIGTGLMCSAFVWPERDYTNGDGNACNTSSHTAFLCKAAGKR